MEPISCRNVITFLIIVIIKTFMNPKSRMQTGIGILFVIISPGSICSKSSLDSITGSLTEN